MSLSILLLIPAPDGVEITNKEAEISIPAVSEDTYKIMSYNIKYSNFITKTKWDKRKEVIKQKINDGDPDIIGFQEVTSGTQSWTLKETLRDKYVEVFHGRRGNGFGEGTPIYYKRDKFDLIHEDVFWLSTTPNEPSTLKGSNIPRICVFVRLKDKRNNKEIVYYNTHLPYERSVDKGFAMSVITSHIADAHYSDDTLVIVGGDFNTFNGSDAYDKIAGEGFTDMGLNAADKVEGPTFDLSIYYGRSMNARIDFLFAKNQKEIPFYRIFNTHIGDVYASDHYAIIVGVK